MTNEEDDDSSVQLSTRLFSEQILTVTQYVYDVIDFSSQYGSDQSISYTASNVVGKPKVYPKSGDSTALYHMRTYGHWWNNLPSSNIVKVPTVLPQTFLPSDDFIEVKFEERVYPTKIEIVETYNPGAIVRILGYCYETARWVVLWQEKSRLHRATHSRIFTPKFKKPNFKTNCLRLEFNLGNLDYHYELDAVVLCGAPIDNETNKRGSIICGFPIVNEFFNFTIESRRKSLTHVVPTKKCWFEKLPIEVMHLILGKLDLQSLCAVSQVSSWFKKLCYDPVLYKALDLKPYWSKVVPETLEGLSGRCSSLQYLNLSWCGSRNLLNPKCIIQFLETSCKYLTCLRISNCAFVNNYVLKAIAKCCQFIEVLEMRSCRNKELSRYGFSQISFMKNLIYLDLYRTSIDGSSMSTIIKSCPALEHLFLGDCYSIRHYNDIAKDIAKYLSGIKTVDLWRAKSLTEEGVTVLAEHCTELVELDLGWCSNVNTNGGCLRQLVRNCSKLKKLFLTAIRTTSDTDLNGIASYSKDLEQLDILGTREVSRCGVYSILQCCEKLKLLDISFCENISSSTYILFKNGFPEVKIKRCLAPEL